MYKNQSMFLPYFLDSRSSTKLLTGYHFIPFISIHHFLSKSLFWLWLLPELNTAFAFVGAELGTHRPHTFLVKQQHCFSYSCNKFFTHFINVRHELVVINERHEDATLWLCFIVANQHFMHLIMIQSVLSIKEEILTWVFFLNMPRRIFT